MQQASSDLESHFRFQMPAVAAARASRQRNLAVQTLVNSQHTRGEKEASKKRKERKNFLERV